MKSTARAIILRNKRLLLVTGHGADYYWTPGGNVEEGESPEQALHREIQEELGARIVSSKWYMTFQYNTQLVTVFIIEVGDAFVAGNEITDYIWYKRGDNIKVSGRLRNVLIPELTRQDLL
jgi:8-oxo-dGTP pyrophosphatase MutT (NUDIX family)